MRAVTGLSGGHLWISSNPGITDLAHNCNFSCILVSFDSVQYSNGAVGPRTAYIAKSIAHTLHRSVLRQSGIGKSGNWKSELELENRELELEIGNWSWKLSN